jgi:c-di-GMP-binding flagellar brake protein YcgR
MSSEDTERITGKLKQDLIEQLKKDKVALQMVLAGRDYERLTMIAGLQAEKGKPFLLIDCPRGFSEDVPNGQGARIKLEFQGKERIQYAFHSRISRVSEDDLWLEMPEFIERVQRRQYFRITPPQGTKVSFFRSGDSIESELVNLSEGGVLLKPLSRGRRLEVGETIRNLRLRCRLENVSAEIQIDKAVVRRQQEDQRTGNVSYAMQFQSLDTKERRPLQEFILNCQREVLRRRALLEE